MRRCHLPLLLCLGCPESQRPPGTQVIGTFALRAEPRGSPSCQMEGFQGAPFEFDAILSQNPNSEEAFLTLPGASRPATWDGQRFVSTAAARRLFGAPCQECGLRLVETLDVVVLSRSQSEAVGNACPPNALDGGVPTPTADGGIVPPTLTPLGFDAVRACGELNLVTRASTLIDGGACAPSCDGCAVGYVVGGERR